jgi:gamma-glutamylcyclotransferase (GGCT)/AIG2-like uncharacterized protein YtfP
MPAVAREFLLFVYDAWMSDQPDCARLANTRPLGPATTEPAFDMIDLGTQGALVLGGTTAVRGEVYALNPPQLATLDVLQGHPLRFKRRTVVLADGREAETYTLDSDQVRGRRRIRSGDWRARLGPPPPPPREGAWSRWAKSRGGGG